MAVARRFAALLFASSAPGVAGLRLTAPSNETAAADPWPTFRGPHLKQFGITDVVVPEKLSTALAWKWHHPSGRYTTTIAGGPVIDAAGNMYLTAADGLRKFSPDGQVLWHALQPDFRINNQPSLWDGKVFCSNSRGEMFALNQEDGRLFWYKKLAKANGQDAGYPAAYDGVFVVGGEEGHDPLSEGGGTKIFGLNASNGDTLWTFEPKKPVWNFAPLFTSDGRAVFMDFSGGMYSVGLHNGTLQWYTPATRANQAFSDGGAVLGPQGDVYACFNPTGGHGQEGERGILRKLQVSDGRVLWDQNLPQPCNSYPAVGKVGPGDELSVVVTPGSFMGSPNLRGSIMAFDVESGALRWAYNMKPFNNPPSYMAKGDPEGYMGRVIHMGHQHNICLPAHWSSANIDGEGYVYAGRSDGYVYAVRAPKDFAAPMEKNVSHLFNNFTSTPGLSVRSWNADGASLHGAFAFAPGRVAFATCDTLYAFNA